MYALRVVGGVTIATQTLLTSVMFQIMVPIIIIIIMTLCKSVMSQKPNLSLNGFGTCQANQIVQSECNSLGDTSSNFISI